MERVGNLMETNKKIVLGILISILLSFVVYICYEHFSWVKSVKDKEFRGTIIQLSSEMGHGKYPRTHEYASILWENGETSYFEMAPVHNYSVGDTWVTKVNQSYFSPSDYYSSIPPSKKEKSGLGLLFILIYASFISIVGTGLVFGTGYLFWWCFHKEKEER